MKIVITRDRLKDIEYIGLYKVDEDHYRMNIHTLEKYYDNYSSISGYMMDKDNTFFNGVGINLYNYIEDDITEESIDNTSSMEICITGENILDFTVLSVIPLKHEYQVDIMKTSKAFGRAELIDEVR